MSNRVQETSTIRTKKLEYPRYKLQEKRYEKIQSKQEKEKDNRLSGDETYEHYTRDTIQDTGKTKIM